MKSYLHWLDQWVLAQLENQTEMENMQINSQKMFICNKKYNLYK